MDVDDTPRDEGAIQQLLLIISAAIPTNVSCATNKCKFVDLAHK